MNKEQILEELRETEQILEATAFALKYQVEIHFEEIQKRLRTLRVRLEATDRRQTNRRTRTRTKKPDRRRKA